jgi:DNA polymerase III subunit delta'
MRFSDVIVRQDVKDRLIQTVREGRISHAQLFSGNDGGAALPLAVAYATYIQCENPSDTDSCGVCSSCIKNSKLIHPDLHFAYPVVTGKEKKPKSTDFIRQWRKAFLADPYLDLNDWYDGLSVDNKQGFMPVEESADILRKMSLKSFEGRYKIQIIWLLEKMRPEASNKLLKIIEEPPENTLFLLITSQREQILPTIRSRTQLVKVPSATPPQIAEVLEKKFNKTPLLARRIANLSNGRINLAFSLAAEETQDQSVEHNFINWMRLCYNPFYEKDGKSAWSDLNGWIDEVSKSGREPMKHFLSFSMEAARECLLTNSDAGELTRFDDSVIPNFSRFSKFIHQGNIGEITGLLNRAHYAVERNANPRILLLDLSFKMNRLLNMKKEQF